MRVSCADCRHLSYEIEDMSDGHWMSTSNQGFVCGARHGVQNLKQFPFSKTQCEKHEARART